jgi:hypothetical protein
VCLNIQDSTGNAIAPRWMLPGIAPALYMLGTELGLAELRLLMRKLRIRIRAYGLPVEPAVPSKKGVVLSVLAETAGHVPAALEVLAERGVSVDRSYVYEIKRGNIGAGQQAHPLDPAARHESAAAQSLKGARENPPLLAADRPWPFRLRARRPGQSGAPTSRVRHGGHARSCRIECVPASPSMGASPRDDS